MRLIDADWVLGHLKPYEPSDEEWIVTGGTALRLIHNAVDNAPTVDAVPVVHGWWNADETCSVCGEKSTEGLDAVKWDYWLPDYCPHCGAKMGGGADHEAD